MKKFLPLFLVLIFIFFFALILLGFSKFKPSQSGSPSLEIIPSSFQGEVSGKTKTILTFGLKNKGEGDLVINGISTSCDCTSAILKKDDKQSPKFSMHTPDFFWKETFKKDEEGLLEVTYDPTVHKAEGKIERVIYIKSNDPTTPNFVLPLSLSLKEGE